MNAVKTDLPPSSREDIGAELQTLLEKSLERETGKAPGALSDEEAIALLIICLVGVWEIARDLWRLSRLGTRRLI